MNNAAVTRRDTVTLPMSHRSYTIGELAREFGVTTRTIRFYEAEGLLSPERRGTARVYSPADRVNLILVLRGKRLGFTLAESREMIGLYDPSSGNTTQLERMLDKLAEKRALLDRQLEDIRLLQAELELAEQRVRDALAETHRAAGSTPGTATPHTASQTTQQPAPPPTHAKARKTRGTP